MINQSNNPIILNNFLVYNQTILNKSENTVKEYNYDLNRFLKYMKLYKSNTPIPSLEEFSKIDIKELDINALRTIDINDIYAYIGYLTNVCNNKPASRARKVASMKSFFNYLTAKTNQLEVNPAQNLESPKLGKRIPKYLTLDESMKLLNTVGNEEDNKNKERDYAIITLFLNCGMRLSELIGINIKDIRFEECRMTVTGKGNKERTIYLNKACMSTINEYLAVRPKLNDVDALFLSERKERISNRTVQYIVRKELLKARLRCK